MVLLLLIRTWRVVPGATYLVEDTGALDEVARQADEWFERYLPHGVRARAGGTINGSIVRFGCRFRNSERRLLVDPEWRVDSDETIPSVPALNARDSGDPVDASRSCCHGRSAVRSIRLKLSCAVELRRCSTYESGAYWINLSAI